MTTNDGHDRKHEDYVRRIMAAQPSLRSFVLSLVRNLHQTEDILQEVALAAWRQFDAYDPSRPFLPWVLAIARNKCVDVARAGKGVPILLDEVARRLEADASELSEEHSRRRGLLAECLRKLSAAARELIALRHHEGLDVREIARREGKTEVAVRRMLARARAFLVRCASHEFPVRTS